MAITIDGKKLAKEVRKRLKQEVAEFSTATKKTPKLDVVMVGDDPASHVYVRNKERACKRAGITSEKHQHPADMTKEDLVTLVQRLNSDVAVNGILVQLPLPGKLHRHEKEILNLIDPLKDVDGFTRHNAAEVMYGSSVLEPCTPKGIVTMLREYEIETSGKHMAVIGRSQIVGKPMAMMASSYGLNCTVSMCNSRTPDDLMRYLVGSADILVAAVGVPELVKGDMVKEGVTVIDVGVNRVDDDSEKGYHLVGDVEHSSVGPKAYAITPVPGGVGPMTIASLLENVVQAAKMQAERKPLTF